MKPSSCAADRGDEAMSRVRPPLLLIVCLTFASAGCGTSTSKHPLYTERELATDDSALGEWGIGSCTGTVDQDPGGKGYRFAGRWDDDKRTDDLVHLLKLG